MLPEAATGNIFKTDFMNKLALILIAASLLSCSKPINDTGQPDQDKKINPLSVHLNATKTPENHIYLDWSYHGIPVDEVISTANLERRYIDEDSFVTETTIKLIPYTLNYIDSNLSLGRYYYRITGHAKKTSPPYHARRYASLWVSARIN